MFYIINKPTGISSFKAIKDFAKQNNIKKIGHSGTLDPLASGLLLVASDDDAKLFNYINDNTKKYYVEAMLGYQSDTYDITGKLIKISDEKITNFELVNRAIMEFLGKSMQIPPSFSAKKIDGVRAYDKARAGENIVLKPVEIEVFSIENIEFNIENQKISFSLHVSSGTYIRSIIHDLGIKLKCGAVMSFLDRFEISSISSNMSNSEIINSLFDNLLFVSMQDAKDIQLNHYNRISKLDWFNKAINNDQYWILKDKNNDQIYGIIETNDKKLSVKKLFGNRIH